MPRARSSIPSRWLAGLRRRSSRGRCSIDRVAGSSSSPATSPVAAAQSVIPERPRAFEPTAVRVNLGLILSFLGPNADTARCASVSRVFHEAAQLELSSRQVIVALSANSRRKGHEVHVLDIITRRCFSLAQLPKETFLPHLSVLDDQITAIARWSGPLRLADSRWNNRGGVRGGGQGTGRKEHVPGDLLTRIGASSGVVGDTLVFAGGYCRPLFKGSIAEDSVVGFTHGFGWRRFPAMHRARSEAASGVLIDERGRELLVVVGGHDGLASTEVFDVIDNQWIEKHPAPVFGCILSSTVCLNRLIVSALTTVPSTLEQCLSIRSYDVHSDTWSALPGLVLDDDDAAAAGDRINTGRLVSIAGNLIALLGVIDQPHCTRAFQLSEGRWTELSGEWIQRSNLEDLLSVVTVPFKSLGEVPTNNTTAK